MRKILYYWIFGACEDPNIIYQRYPELNWFQRLILRIICPDIKKKAEG